MTECGLIVQRFLIVHPFHVDLFVQVSAAAVRRRWNSLSCLKGQHRWYRSLCASHGARFAEDFAPRHTIAPYANWLLPGYVMVGRYPFLEPSRLAQDRGAAEAQISAILTAGITTFVSLQAEVPPQLEMPIGGVDGFIPYKATADLIAAGALFFLSTKGYDQKQQRL